MTKGELVEIVGRERYRRECELARADAARPDYGRDLGEHAVKLELPHELEQYIWDEGLGGWPERIALCFAVYDDMPAYGHLMYATHRYPEFGPEDREGWWSAVRARLTGPDAALRRPLQYALWCDFFEDPDTVEEAWAALAGPGAAPALLRAVLPVSGPVPYALKGLVYERLLGHAAWHEAIFESLLRSAFDVYGDVDKEAARHTLSRLQLPAGLAYVEDLRVKLM
jgi:hypothetical protein